MAHGDQIQRQWVLLQLLQTRGYGVPLRDLVEELEVSERTIQRDFELLVELEWATNGQNFGAVGFFSRSSPQSVV